MRNEWLKVIIICVSLKHKVTTSEELCFFSKKKYVLVKYSLYNQYPVFKYRVKNVPSVCKLYEQATSMWCLTIGYNGRVKVVKPVVWFLNYPQ